jgi:hypothetical protein
MAGGNKAERAEHRIREDCEQSHSPKVSRRGVHIERGIARHNYSDSVGTISLPFFFFTDSKYFHEAVGVALNYSRVKKQLKVLAEGAEVWSCHSRFPKQTKCYLYVCQDLVPYV